MHNGRKSPPGPWVNFRRLPSVAAGPALLGSGELQAARSPQVDPVAARPAHDAHQNLLAPRAADDNAGGVKIDVDPTYRVDGATARARALGGGHLHGEDLAQETSNCVAVNLRLSCFHRHPPVAPNLSVLILRGS